MRRNEKYISTSAVIVIILVYDECGALYLYSCIIVDFVITIVLIVSLSIVIWIYYACMCGMWYRTNKNVNIGKLFLQIN